MTAWSKPPPTEPGWWWIRGPRGSKTIVGVFPSGDHLYVGRFMVHASRPLGEYAEFEWQGPIRPGE